MFREHLIDRAVATALEFVRDIEPDQLGAPTPCAGFDVRNLVDHLLFRGPSTTAAAREERVPPPAAAGDDVDLTPGDWAADLTARLLDHAAAWGEASAWEAELLEFVRADLVRTAPVGRGMGLFGPEAPAPPDAPLIDQVVALTGRTPQSHSDCQ
ncbi:maleylpyruvate isomerase N-terminal domain-containing protein [Saccharothrix sp. HUAS TT1]|uniref:maleylpyruvate isomerase N-terminal domain-containing protein n=1 Tax=unclassified Saccharothrix TaxID=2593673 RepID=UPI00345C1A8B